VYTRKAQTVFVDGYPNT